MSLLSCAHGQRPAGRSFSHDGLPREYLLYAPTLKPNHSGKRPLLFALHGGGGTHRGMVRLTRRRFNELADRDGFFVVYPQGVDKSWNDGRPDKISGAHRKGIDDVGFFGALIEHLIYEYPIDSARIFVTGISNGGLMSFRLGCTLNDKIRAIAPVTAQIPSALEPLCRSESEVSLAVSTGPRIRWFHITAGKSPSSGSDGERCCQRMKPSGFGKTKIAAALKQG